MSRRHWGVVFLAGMFVGACRTETFEALPDASVMPEMADMCISRRIWFPRQDKPLAGGGGNFGTAIADLDRDGINDLVTTIIESSTENVLVLRGMGGGSFAPPVVYDGGGKPHSVRVVDFNEDGKLDLVIGNASGASISWMPGRGDGSFGEHVSVPVMVDTSWADAVDLDGDGHFDLVASEGRGIDLLILRGHGDGRVDAPVRIPSGQQPAYFAPLDCNGDGLLDLAVPNYGDNTFVVLENLGAMRFSTSWMGKVGWWSMAAAAADFDGDGRVDLAVTSDQEQAVHIFLGKGDCTFRQGSSSITGVHEPFVIAADLDGDARPELIVPVQPDLDFRGAQRAPGGLEIYRNERCGPGDPQFTRAVNFPFTDTPGTVAAGDLDGDRLPDIALSIHLGASLRLYLTRP